MSQITRVSPELIGSVLLAEPIEAIMVRSEEQAV